MHSDDSTKRPDMVDRWAKLRAERTPPNSSGLCLCGCGQPAPVAKSTDPITGNVKGFPQRYIRGHNKRAVIAYIVDPLTECWRWQLYVNPAGYGLVKDQGRERFAHIVYYERKYGPVPEGMELDHVKARGCVYRDCVNPEHLEPVTHAENMRRGVRQKLTPEQTAELLMLVATTMPVTDIAARYNITPGRVYQLQRAHGVVMPHRVKRPSRTA